MDQNKIGIDDIAIYLPVPRMRMDSLIESRSISHPELLSVLKKAIDKTGLKSFRFPDPWEDTASLAANAAALMFDRIDPNQIAALRWIASGTETAVDHSKPVSSYVQGMLQEAGYNVGTRLTTFEMKHACAGATAALLSSATMLGYSGNTDEAALVVCSDISRYEAPSSAELTQGAGAAALMVKRNPRLLEIDLCHQGYFSSNVDDFFRPLGSVTAKVKGQYSMKCYQEALIAAFDDYCHRIKQEPQEVLNSTDYLALHVPFPKMPEVAVSKLFSRVCGRNSRALDQFLDRTGFLDAMYLSRETGNLYTVSLYAYLTALLEQEWNQKGDGIVGKSILIASYGSGNTMIVFKGIISPGAPEVISKWHIREGLKKYRDVDFHEYLNWLARPKDYRVLKNLLEGATPSKGMFYLKDFTETGFRLYDRA